MTTQSVSWAAELDTVSSLVADTAALGIEERLGGHLSPDPLAEDVDLDALPHLDRRWDVGVGDRPRDRVAVAAARHAADDLVFDPHRLIAQRDRARVVEDQAAQAPLDRALVQGGAAEVVLVALDA